MTLSSSVFLSLPLPLVSTLVLLYFSFSRWRRPLSHLPYMPGPPVTNLISGNASQVPQAKSWATYMEWGKRYMSDIIHFRIYNQHTIILNSYEACVELLEQRSNNYSDRPHTMMIDLMGWDFNTGFKRYGEEWRTHRRLYQQLFKQKAALNYRPIQTKKVHELLYSLLTSPSDFMNHYRTLAAAIIMSAMYGHDVAPKNDYYVGLAEAAVARLGESIFPGAVAVNALPFLRFLPSWFPGAGFKRFGDEVSELTRQMREVPIDVLKKQMEVGDAPPCAALGLLETRPSGDELDAIIAVISTSYAAGADTTVSALGAFFLAMTKFPEAQKKAQEEIDAIVGQDRLVTYDDRKSLPYVEALYREVLRWRPVLPLGVSHAAVDDDVYKGHYIAKGTMVITNTWAMAHNPIKYPEPDVFNPGRFFTKEGELNNDQCSYIFGFGRRICPGRHMASATVWLTIAAVLQSFNISNKKDASGNDIPVSGEYSDGLVIHPLPYESTISPRTETTHRLILQAVGKE